MEPLTHIYPLLIPMAPLAAALLTALPGGWISEKNYRIGLLFHAVAFGCAVLLLFKITGPETTVIRLPFLPLPWGGLPPFELLIDRLAAVMMVLISGIGALLYLYSMRYMQQDSGRARYQTLLAFQVTTLLFMVSSSNLVMLFLFWQLLS